MEKSERMITELAGLEDAEMRRVVYAARRKRLDALWRDQMKKVAVPWIYQGIAWHFSHQRLVLLDRAQEMEFAPDAVPFLPVVPFVWRACPDQMRDLADGRNFAAIDTTFAHDLHDRIESHGYPYYIYDVRLGDPIGPAGIRQAAAELKSAGRRPLTAAETVSLALHRPEWLDSDGLVPGSSGSQEGAVGRKCSFDLLLARAILHPIELFGLDGAAECIPKAHLPSCAGDFDPRMLWCEAEDE